MMQRRRTTDWERVVKLKIRATAICFRQDRLLLVSKDGVKWALPGGRPAENEPLAEAAQRELEEETTLSAKGVGFLFQIIGPTTVHHVFLANIGKTAVPKPGKEIAQCQWFSPSEMNEIVVGTTTRHIVDSFLARRSR